MKRKLLLLTFALPAILSQNIQAQNSSRLVASSHWANNGVIFLPVDSSAYNYSGGRGGDLMHTLKYDNATTWNWVDSATGYENYQNYIQEFDANNNIASTTYQYWSGSAWVLSTKVLYTYNANNQVLTMTNQTWNGSSFVAVSQDAYSYNAAGKMYLDQYGVWNALTMVFDATSQKTYIYDATNTNVTNETDLNVAGTPSYTFKYDYTYSATNKMVTVTKSTWNGAAWVPTYMYTNSYDGSTDNKTSWLYQTWDVPSATFVNNTLHSYTYSGGTMPTVDVLQSWSDTGSTWQNVMQFVNTYNGSNQLTSSEGTAWNTVGIFEHALGDPLARYYYETYDTTKQAVTPVSNAYGSASIYPVPAQNMLHVDLTWNQAQTATIQVYNAQGSVVRQWDSPNTAQYNSAVSLNNLAEGMYFIKISGAQGEITKQFVIAR